MTGRFLLPGRSLRAASFAALGALTLLTAGRDARPDTAETDNVCVGNESPDIIVGDISGDHIVSDVRRWGTVGGITAYSFSATSCNIGTCEADWFADDNTHPVISQNIFVMKDGRFQQIGQSWIKHAWGADTGSLCGTCTSGDYSHMGVNCSDLYDTSGNGGQNRLGDKYPVNPYTGYYPFPQANLNLSGNQIYKRLQVHNYDLDPASNPAAKYFVEMQYLQYQDASHQLGDNNASYRPILVTGNSATSVYNIALTGQTVVGQPAIMAWKAADPSVIINVASMPNDGKLLIGTKVSYRGGGVWRYEYAIQNLNAAKAPLAIQIPFPSGTVISSSSYHDVDYHSDSIQDNTPWTRTTTATAVQWKAATLVLNGLVPNALRWGTLYNFRIDANAAPGTHAITLGYADPPHPVFEISMNIPALTPSVCDSDGICDPGETCASCAADCVSQGGGSGCCGNASCEAGETESTCFADCGQPLAAESSCGDGIDGDRDGIIDCFDTDCCSDAACDGFDVDGDGLAAACDCSDSDRTVWKTPGEATDLHVYYYSGGAYTFMVWATPAEPGGTADMYDVIRSETPTDFSAGSCIYVNPGDNTTTDSLDPSPGAGVFYLVRAKNNCASGIGPLGWSSAGTPYTAPPCP
jgi:hypothetical protein